MIGVFDSGVGGLSVWQEIYKLMPKQDYIYFSDAAHCPYGTKPVEYIRQRSDIVTRLFLERGVDIVVVACNTATAAAIDYLRSTFSIPFVGIEPAIKPAAITSSTGVVGVLATANTLKGALYHNTLERFASNVKVIERVGEGLVELVESGLTSGPLVDERLHHCLDDMVSSGADRIVLGCTHYPFLIDVISEIVGPDVKILNPAFAVATQTVRIAESLNLLPVANPSLTFLSSGGTDTLKLLVGRIVPNLNETNFSTFQT